MKRYTIEDIYTEKKKKEESRKILRIIIYILVIPLLVYNLIILSQVIISSDTTPSFFGYKTFVIVSGSMDPELQIGDIVVIKDLDEQDEIKIGDIISYREGNSVITHRITKIIEEEIIKYKTKGDANNAEDVNHVTRENIEGKYSFRIPKLGQLVIFMQNKVGIIFVAIMIYIIYICNKNREERIIRRKEKREFYEKIIKEKE